MATALSQNVQNRLEFTPVTPMQTATPAKPAKKPKPAKAATQSTTLNKGYPMPDFGEENLVTISRGFRVPWYKLDEDNPIFRQNMAELARLQRRANRQEERETVRTENKPMTATVLGEGGTPAETAPTTATTNKPTKTTTTSTGPGTGAQKKGERASSAFPARLEKRHQRLLKRIRRLSKRSLPPEAPAPLAPYQYSGATSYQPSGAMVSTTQSQGMMGTILG